MKKKKKNFGMSDPYVELYVMKIKNTSYRHRETKKENEIEYFILREQ